MSIFKYHPDILTRFPQVVGGVVWARDLQNGPAPDQLLAEYQDEQRKVSAQIGDTPLSELEPLAAWRTTFRAFGVNPTKYRSAVEALLRRLTKKGNIPSINTIVDLCNLVSIRYQLPVAAIDLQAIQGTVTVYFARGDETFNPLGAAGPETPESGEVIFGDEQGLIVARRWCWRQSVESAANPKTSEVIVTVEAQHPNAHETVVSAMRDLNTLLQTYAGGECASALLDAQRPAFTL